MSEQFAELAKRVNNWGRWGPDDERGTLNLLTPEAVRRGAACIRTGQRLSLALPLWEHGPQTGLIRGRVNPLRTMIAINTPLTREADGFCSSDDVVVMGLQAATHWDALAHVSYQGRVYNGFGTDSVSVRGAARCGIDKAGVIAGRGVLLDVARAMSVARLEGGYAITPEDLDAAEALARTAVGAGDIVLVRTGQMQLLQGRDRDGYAFPSPGLTMATAAWFHDRDVAAVATDNLTLEVVPGEDDAATLPVHLLHLVEMGLTQGQNFDLEELAAACADDAAYEFFIEATPEPFVKGLGGPVAPVVVR